MKSGLSRDATGLTIGPNFLKELEADKSELKRVLFPDEGADFIDCDFGDEADFRAQLEANQMATDKLDEGIRGFVADQIKLETLLEQVRVEQVA